MTDKDSHEFGARDWEAAATEAADRLATHRFEEHRGAMSWWKPGTAIAFGNDGYSGDDRAQQEVALLRQTLDDLGFVERGFGVDSKDGYTWAMIIEDPRLGCPEADGEAKPDAWAGRVPSAIYLPTLIMALHVAVVEAWRIVCGESIDSPSWTAFKRAQGLMGPEDFEPPKPQGEEGDGSFGQSESGEA